MNFIKYTETTVAWNIGPVFEEYPDCLSHYTLKVYASFNILKF